MDRRWQLVLDCMDHAVAPFSKTTLVAFRARRIEHNLDRRVVASVARTVALYGQLSGQVAGGKLRAALDSSPLWGRVEDTINLLGHALRKVVGVLARQQGWGWRKAPSAGPPWPTRRGARAGRLESEGGVGWRWIWTGMTRPRWARAWGGAGCGGPGGGLAAELGGAKDPGVAGGLVAARQVRDQDSVAGADGAVQLRQGWPVTGGSRSRTHRCATAARPKASGSTATSATC